MEKKGMFTLYHALVIVATAALGGYVGYCFGKADGREEMLREIEDTERARMWME